jgi:peptidoglycan/xylan/chitin deacetylase (PgdA/CDA1 family)
MLANATVEKAGIEPALRDAVLAALQAADRAVSSLAPLLDRPGLLTLYFHGIAADDAEYEARIVDPQERLTVERLERLIGYLRGHGYRFVALKEITTGLPATGRYVHVTFDDGYASNLALVGLAGRLRVPFTIFVTTRHVQDGRPFWWDVLYRERCRSVGPRALAREATWLRSQHHDEIDRYLTERFGDRARRPVGDLDRPLSPEELSRLADEPLITIGNHTADHAYLPCYREADVEQQILEAQAYLEQATGVRPTAIAYPYGAFNRPVIAIAAACGLRTGFTIEGRRLSVPLDERGMLTLGRYRIAADGDFLGQARILRSSLQLEHASRRLWRRFGLGEAL